MKRSTSVPSHKTMPSALAAWRIYILGYVAIYVPSTRTLNFMGPRTGAAWVRVSQLRRILGCRITVHDLPAFRRANDPTAIARHPGLEMVAL